MSDWRTGWMDGWKSMGVEAGGHKWQFRCVLLSCVKLPLGHEYSSSEGAALALGLRSGSAPPAAWPGGGPFEAI